MSRGRFSVCSLLLFLRKEHSYGLQDMQHDWVAGQVSEQLHRLHNGLGPWMMGAPKVAALQVYLDQRIRLGLLGTVNNASIKSQALQFYWLTSSALLGLRVTHHARAALNL